MKLRLGATELELSYTLLCAAAVCVLSGLWSRFVWCAAAIAIHEGGHLLVMACSGYFPKRIKISLFAIDITDSARQQRSARENLRIIFFGPFANFICFLPSYLLYLIGIASILPFAAANLSVGLFNLLPVMSLDGGQLLYLLLCRRLPHEKAEKAVDVLTFALLLPLAALGLWVLLESKHNFSLLFVCAYLVLSLLLRDNRYY